MSMISISNLADGSDLLNDSESFLTDLSDAELQISGGGGKCRKRKKSKKSKKRKGCKTSRSSSSS